MVTFEWVGKCKSCGNYVLMSWASQAFCPRTVAGRRGFPVECGGGVESVDELTGDLTREVLVSTFKLGGPQAVAELIASRR